MPLMIGVFMSYLDREYERKRVEDAWGKCEITDDCRSSDQTKRGSMAEVVFEFAETNVHTVTCRTDHKTADAIVNGEMNELTEQFLDEYPEAREYLSNIDKPSWCRNAGDPDSTECLTVLVHSLKGF